MKSNQITGLLFLCLLLFGCKKEPDNTVKPPDYHFDTDYINNNLKQNYIFNTGSRWIYKSNNALIDTILLVTQNHIIRYPSYIHGYPVTNYLEYYLTDYQSSINGKISDVYFKHLWYRNPTDWYWTGFYDHGVIYFTSDTLEIIDSLTLFGKTYMNVAKVQKLKDENENYYDTYYYFAPHFGIIRKEIKDSITWNLYESDIK